MTTLHQPNTDWMSAQDKVLAMSDSQLNTKVPSVMRAQGFSEAEICRAIQIVAEFRDRHKMPVID